MKIILNKCYGGFGFSALAYEMYLKSIGKECYFYIQSKYNYSDGIEEYKKISTQQADVDKTHICFYCLNKDVGDVTNKFSNEWHVHLRDENIRKDKNMIEIVEKLGKQANGKHAELEIVEIPDDMEWTIEEYDGIESLHEIHRSW